MLIKRLFAYNVLFMMKKWFILFCILTGGAFVSAQERVLLKTNVLYDLTSTINLGVEVPLSKHFSAELSGNYNPWSLGSHSSLKHWLVQPEGRYWFCSALKKHFIGLHGLYGQYDVRGINLPLIPSLKDTRYNGSLWGVGISYGYQWPISKQWSMEASLGVGYVELKDQPGKLADPANSSVRANRTCRYVGPTKLSLSFIYVIN